MRAKTIMMQYSFNSRQLIIVFFTKRINDHIVSINGDFVQVIFNGKITYDEKTEGGNNIFNPKLIVRKKEFKKIFNCEI